MALDEDFSFPGNHLMEHTTMHHSLLNHPRCTKNDNLLPGIPWKEVKQTIFKASTGKAVSCTIHAALNMIICLPGIPWKEVEQPVVTAQHDRRPCGAALRLARLREGH
jgi:hypothetical protein